MTRSYLTVFKEILLVSRTPFFKILLFSSLLLFGQHLNPNSLLAREGASSAQNWQGASLTLYKTMALVRDKSSVFLKKGEDSQLLHPVSGKIIPESTVISCSEADVLEQSFVYRPITPEAILKSYEGKKVLLIKTDKKTGKEHAVPAKVLSVKNGIVLKVEGRIETAIPGRLAFPELPKGLGKKPVLKIVLKGKSDGKAPVEVSYLSRGLSWKADYVAVLNESEDSMRLDGRVSIKNRSGITFENALVQLVAGDVNEGTGPPEINRSFAMKKAAMAAPIDPDVSRETLFEYHLYNIDRPVSLEKDQPKEITLFSASGIPCSKEFLAIGNRYTYTRRSTGRGEQVVVAAVISFKNDKSSHIGIPMPQGEVRMYKKDSAGRLQFIGKDEINHVPQDEKVRLNLGKAFDIVCTRLQTDFKKLADSNKYSSLYENSYEVTVKNSKDEPVTVKYMEPVSGTWQITAENQEHQKMDANTALWKLDVPAHGQKVLKFTVRVRY